MMNWILLVMAAIAAVVTAMIVGGLLAPRTRTVTRSLHSEAPLSKLYALVRAADGPPRWHPELPTMHVQSEQAPHALEFRIVDDDGRDIGTWSIALSAHDSDTIVRITERVTVHNPIVRFVRSLGGQGARVDAFLRAVAAESGVPARIA